MNQEPLFYIPSPSDDQDVDGPYDLSQMALLLRSNVITAETPTCLDGQEEWKPFGERPHFALARDMPPEQVAVPASNQSGDPINRQPPPPPQPEVPIVLIAIACVLLALLGSVAFYISALDPDMGIGFAIAGLIASSIGFTFILVNVVDESLLMRAKVLLVPFFDVYYFSPYLEKYLPILCAKYLGLVLALSSVAGVLTGMNAGQS